MEVMFSWSLSTLEPNLRLALPRLLEQGSSKRLMVSLCYWHWKIGRFPIDGATAAPGPAGAAQDDRSPSCEVGSVEPDQSILGIVLLAAGGGKQDVAAKADTAQCLYRSIMSTQRLYSHFGTGFRPIKCVCAHLPNCFKMGLRWEYMHLYRHV
jgi:hypothetical protein